MFRDQLYDIRQLFQKKVEEFREFNQAIQENHEVISSQYEATQRKLKSKLDRILEEKRQWEDEKRLLKAKNGFDSDILQLNVGGTHRLMVSTKVLQSVTGSQLQKMFAGMHELKKVDDCVFLDRDGATFQTLINYLRNDRKIYPEFDNVNDQKQFTEELNFWGIKDDRQEEKRLESKFPPEIVEMLKVEPGEELDFSEKNEVQDLVRQTWQMLGPLRLIEIARNSVDPIEFDMPFGKSVDKYRTHIYGQYVEDKSECEGICRLIFAEPNSHVYEGQCKNG